MANLLLDSIIEQARQRNARILDQNQARWVPKPVAPAPVSDGFTPIGDTGASSGSWQGEFLGGDYSPMSNQQQYDAAAKYLSQPLATRLALPFGGVQTLGANYQLNQAAQDPNVMTDLTVGDPYAPQSALNWAQEQPQLAKEINPAWNEMRSRVVFGEQRDAETESGIRSMGGFGSQQMGMSLGNFGETAEDPSASAPADTGDASSPNDSDPIAYYDFNTGTWSDGSSFGGSRVGGGGGGDDSWGGAGFGAVGGDYGMGDDFGGYA